MKHLNLKWLAASALALTTLSGASALASTCQLYVDNTQDGSGQLVASVAPGVSGFYVLDAQQIMPGSYMDISQSGPIWPQNHWQRLTSASLNTSYTMPAGSRIAEAPRGLRTLNDEYVDGRYGQDVSFQADLTVYGPTGQVICQQSIDAPRQPARFQAPFGY